MTKIGEANVDIFIVTQKIEKRINNIKFFLICELLVSSKILIK